ncbi:MAG TPA: phosphoribosylglycinamide formyltransferase [Phycisphaerales bacterium]|nr:phosphoribosylglycinamide formyltransferase [Phycisphaerales bacterium]
MTSAGAGRPGSDRARLAVLLSGGGRTLTNLLDEIDAGRLHAEVALVIASRECPGAQKARDRGLAVEVVPGVIPGPDLQHRLAGARIAWVVLAGYLKYVNVPPAYTGRVVNIHPALLPHHGGHRMYGDRVHEAVLAAGDAESGCTVHLVDEHYDQGRIILQRRCPVLPADTPQTLAARVFEQERVAYPEALRHLFAEYGTGVPDHARGDAL